MLVRTCMVCVLRASGGMKHSAGVFPTSASSDQSVNLTFTITIKAIINYEYIGTYKDDLIVVSRNCIGILNVLQLGPYNFKLKGTSNIDGAVHLGSFLSRDTDGTLTMNPTDYL